MLNLPHTIHVPNHPNKKLGFKFPHTAPRVSFTHMKMALGIQVPEHPVTFDFASSFPDDSGALANDYLGDCAFAGPYHGIQLAVWNIRGKLISATALTPLAVQLYEKLGHYNPSAPLVLDHQSGQMVNPTDQGGDPILLAEEFLDNPLPLPEDPALPVTEKEDDFFFTFEIDPANLSDVAFVASECYGVGIGVMVSDQVMPSTGVVPTVWPNGGVMMGGHYIWVTGYDGTNWHNISWGMKYGMSPEFMRPFNGTNLTNGNLMMVVGYIHSVMFDNNNTVMGKTKEELREYCARYATSLPAKAITA